MIKLQQLIGLPVIVIHSGRMVGTVKDAWFDEHWQLKGIILEYAKWFALSVKTVKWSDVLSCGEDTVIISSETAIVRMKPKQILRSFYTGLVKLRDLPVVTVLGEQLGRVSDVYFYPNQGTQIVGYELTDGFVSDLMEGRKWLRAPSDPDAVLLGEDAIIVPAVSEAELEPVAASNSIDREK
ncbi:PRC-barrel domain-containing protein [Paenibacillus arenilitoris]|uniref:PRC-barrel domain-containing protein n=1 Tax=Paenibacillus arenilitoris TaxID=2772299 RepID=A0A927CMQ7_9BACL|nr:PRC-barrel domain-containing protein [Paenibacillus arenilitoris]MBD2870399.1 PRC-barrel domain-containing protein [Paenibacillus arenilitoris]